MIIYHCDNKGCMEQSPHPLQIHLKGYVGNTGGILIPKQFIEFEFCCDNCFLTWVKAASVWTKDNNTNR